jgi:hypothetical protein
MGIFYIAAFNRVGETVELFVPAPSSRAIIFMRRLYNFIIHYNDISLQTLGFLEVDRHNAARATITSALQSFALSPRHAISSTIYAAYVFGMTLGGELRCRAHHVTLPIIGGPSRLQRWRMTFALHEAIKILRRPLILAAIKLLLGIGGHAFMLRLRGRIAHRRRCARIEG